VVEAEINASEAEVMALQEQIKEMFAETQGMEWVIPESSMTFYEQWMDELTHSQTRLNQLFDERNQKEGAYYQQLALVQHKITDAGTLIASLEGQLRTAQIGDEDIDNHIVEQLEAAQKALEELNQEKSQIQVEWTAESFHLDANITDAEQDISFLQRAIENL